MLGNSILNQKQPNSNTPLLTPELITKISERSGIEPRFVELWGKYLTTDITIDADGERLIKIWLNILASEEGVK